MKKIDGVIKEVCMNKNSNNFLKGGEELQSSNKNVNILKNYQMNY